MNRLKVAFGFDVLNPSTLFNPFHKMWNTSYWLWGKLWVKFFQNVRYEFLDRPRWRM